ncbi:MAG: penicillin-binding transpeptidase domain-containing protein [Patescibacteria group bacterium]
MKLGKAFSDSLIVEAKRAKRLRDDEESFWWLGAGRALIVATVFCVAFFVLIWRLFTLTVIDGRRYRMLADGNRIKELVRHAPRGLLLDRTGKPLVANIPQYRLIAPCGTGSVCTKRLSKEEGEQLEKDGLPAGQFLEVDYSRQYLYSSSLAHVVGYTGELSEKELATEYFSLRTYRTGDRVGRTGAEAVYEDRLRGRDGKELVEVDAQGRILRILGRDPEEKGEDITLSLDANLARVAEAAFAGVAKSGVVDRGAVVATKPTTGEVLVLYSSPSYDPNLFSLGMSQAQYEALVNDPAIPMFMRAIAGVYPPGSTFKIVTSVAGFEEGVITKDTTVEDTGIIKIGVFTFPNWYFLQYGKTDGVVDLVKALQRSNDIFFYKVGEWLGVTKLTGWARRVGLGKPLGIELAGEASGLLPDPAWKATRFDTAADRAARNDQWYLGDTYHMAIGQGYLLTTPLQVNAWTNVIANGGKVCKPTIEKTTNSKQQTINCKDLGIKKDTIDLITEGMRKACEPGGTGWPLFNFSVNASTRQRVNEEHKESSPSADALIHGRNDTIFVPVACKTGTAEFGDPQNRTHAWFTVFAPVKSGSGLENSETTPHLDAIRGEPEISITVLVEGAGEGSSVAAPVAKKILEEWFSR